MRYIYAKQNDRVHIAAPKVVSACGASSAWTTDVKETKDQATCPLCVLKLFQDGFSLTEIASFSGWSITEIEDLVRKELQNG